MIRGLWDQQDDTITDIKLGYDNTYSYKYEPMDMLLAWWENITKNKHGKHCQEHRKVFLYLSFLSTTCYGGNP